MTTGYRFNCTATGAGKPSTNGETPASSNEVVRNPENLNAIVRVKRMPLTLIEEVSLPQRVLSDLELIMMAWCEEHAQRLAMMSMVLRVLVLLTTSFCCWIFYRTQISSDKKFRGVESMPANLRIGSVVYFDISENGLSIGRIAIGLLNENCPLYCEYFHRRCTGNGDKGESFRGMPMSAIIPHHSLIFGSGTDMKHDVPGFNASYLPTEWLAPQGLWRGAVASIAYGNHRESPNFAIYSSGGDTCPQVFGLVIGGYNVVDRMNRTGSKHGNAPKREYVIEDCGELCTLAKALIVPMPNKLFESVSFGYDEDKYGPKSNMNISAMIDGNYVIYPTVGGSKPWWQLW